MPTIGVLLSGCGGYDGSEIHESVFTLLALDRAGAEVDFIAPSVSQADVVNHHSGTPAAGDKRNALVESARIARGNIVAAATVDPDDLDGLILPGGFGAAKTLSSFATEGPNCHVHPDVERLVRAMGAAGKPIGFICIAPAIAARIIGDGVRVTIGSDAGTAKAIEAMGGRHVTCAVNEIAWDKDKKVVSVPAYMCGDARPKDIFEGIEKLVLKVVELAA